MDDQKLPVSALYGLGFTQIIGYGTLYYAFSILVPDIARQLGWSEQWVFGAFSGSLLAGSLIAPTAGHWADRIGAGRLMAVGSVGAAIALLLTAAAPGPITFCLALALTQVVSATVLYSTAFVAIVQIGGRKAQKSCVHLTLIAGFASTLFWSLTSWLHDWMSWRQVYLLFALLNIGVCFPIHLWLARLSSSKGAGEQPTHSFASAVSPTTPPQKGQLIFILMLIGFAIEGYALSAVLVHMVPLTQALGLGAFGIYIASLFGPSQVASRFVNLLFGGGLTQTWLAVIATLFLPLGLAILLPTSPWIVGAVAFAICVGLGSGLTSIVGGTLPLELFGREGYGKRLGWCTSAKQFTSAIAPVSMSASLSAVGVVPSLWIVALIGMVGAIAFLAIPLIVRQGMITSPLNA
ncbi:arsenite efflux MFS transporter ArsK [Pararhizobium sp. A13]|uniref:arsenite efflux MFS transporter ArsK n=1 Tax=Pararhizobium sp. A13 TaxID=3133975 RepID=UPI00311B044F